MFFKLEFNKNFKTKTCVEFEFTEKNFIRRFAKFELNELF